MQNTMFLEVLVLGIFFLGLDLSSSVMIIKQPSGSGVCNYTCISGERGKKLRMSSQCLKQGVAGNQEQDNNAILEVYSKDSCPQDSIACLESCQLCPSQKGNPSSQGKDDLFQLLRDGFTPSKGKFVQIISLSYFSTAVILIDI